MYTSGKALLAMVVLLALVSSAATAHEAPRLVEYLSSPGWTAESLSADQSATLESIRSDPAAVEVRIGQSFPGAVRNARALSLEVPASPDGGAATMVSLHDLDVELRSEEDYSLYARDESSGWEVSLAVLGPDVLGTLRRDAEVYKVHPLGGGLAAVYRYESRLAEVESERDVEPVKAPWGTVALSADTDRLPGSPTESGDAVPVIDVLIAYTRRARVEAGNVSALIRHAVDQFNRVLDNSRVRARARLIHSYQTEYVEGDDMGIDADRLVSADDGHLDRIHAVRDRHGADVLVLIRGYHPWCWYAYGPYGDRYAVSVVSQSCAGNYGLAQAFGWNLGAYRDPESSTNRRFPYGHALCHDPGNWRTLMSRSPNESCPVFQPYFSNPDVSFMGTPTGDSDTRNNARVINETAPVVAGYRRAPAATHSVPLVPSTDSASRQGFVRVVNRSGRAGTVHIHAIDDEGRRFGPVQLSLGAKHTAHFNSLDLEDGNTSKGLSGGVGNGTGSWRLELESALDIEVLAYIRTSDGFLTSIHQVAAQANDGSTTFHVPIFNPGSNVDQRSLLRLINLGQSPSWVVISGKDDRGARGEARLRFTLPAGAARLLSARELERGADGIDGRFGSGSGKWQLSISAGQPIQVMSLLLSPTGNLTNLSR